AAKSWDAEISRLEILAARTIDIETGEDDWDIALALAQKDALSGYVGPTRHLPKPSFVLTRVPDRGYSAQGDGSDYAHQWEGQTAADAYVNLAQILPIAPEFAQGVLRNFISAQNADGNVDWKPGLGGQRIGMLSSPLLATLTWKTYLHTEDLGFLRDMFRPLIDFFESWFDRQHDRDEDGHPEWGSTTQSGFDDIPSFVRWHSWGQGLDIS
ncbi:MAG: hypothetical protein GTO14_09310, partial [Anaerolineales bacterium]|nr:hypothetical protein [Anaerolineales bacterium]